jgi:hypothetical protein
MKGIVNPFEPWRPVDVPIPPPLHAARPWRPVPPRRPALEDEIPLAELVDPSTRKPDGKRGCCERKRAARRERNNRRASVPPRTGEAKRCRVLSVFVLLLGALAIVGFSFIGQTHFFRALLTQFALAAGFGMGLSRGSDRPWRVRLGWMAAGLALAGLSAWFVPTVNGVNLWSAYRQVEELRELPAGEVAQFRRGAVERRLVVEDFPTFASDLKAGELAWMRRTVDEAIESADLQIVLDPRAAVSDLRKLIDELNGLNHFDAVRDELQSALKKAEQAAAKRTVRG